MEKMLVTSIFSCAHNVTRRLVFQEKLLTHSHTMTPFNALGNKPLENTVGKGEIARNEQFLFFPQCFLPVWIAFAIFVKFEIVVCKLFQFERV